jgi:hypothetical protein
MPNGDNVKSWADISKNFDAMMPAELYDNLRLKYFTSFVQPKIGQGKSVEATYAKFKELTERKPLLGPGGKALLHVKLGATAAASAMLDPLKSLSPQAKELSNKLQATELQLTKIGEREGMNTTVARTAGSLAGQAVDFAVITAALGPEAGLLAEEMTSTAKGADLVTRTLRGGLAFGAYDALSADGKDNRLMAGLKGFAVGASLDLALGLPGYLKHSGVAKGLEDAESLVTEASTGKAKSTLTDAAIAKKAVHDAETGRLELRPERGHWQYQTGQRGARVYVKDVAGQVTPFDIRQGREYETYRQVRSLVEQGGSVSHYEVHPDDQLRLNEFVRIQTNAEEAKYRGTVVRTAPGQAEEIAAVAKAEGIPSTSLSRDTVELGTVPIEHPILNKPEARLEGSVPEEPPSLEQISQAIDSNAKFDAKTKEFLKYHVNKTWDSNIDWEDKRSSVVITARHTPELLPEEFKTRLEQTRKGVPGRPSRPEPVEEPSEAEQVRQSEIDKASKFGKPKVTKEFDVKDKIPRSEKRAYRKVRAGISAEGETHSMLTDAIDQSGDQRLLANPAGRKTVGSQVEEASLSGRLMGSIEDVDPQSVMSTGIALMKKGYKILPLKGYETGKFELVYFREGDLAKVAPLIEDYDQYISKQAGRVFDTDGRPLRTLGQEAHNRLAKAFGIPPEAFARAGDLNTRIGGSRPAPEIVHKPYGNRLVLKAEDIARLFPNAEGLTHPEFNQFVKDLGIDLPPSLQEAGPVMMLTPETPKDVIFHERLHVNGMYAGTYDEFPSHVSEGSKQTALELVAGLSKDFPGYRQQSTHQLTEEAFVHAATALRYGDTPYLEHLSRYDRSIRHILDFVADTASNLLERSFRARDSVPVRIYQRTLWDLMRRADPQVSEALRSGIRATGTGLASWYDTASDSWILRESHTTETRFKDINDLWDHVTSHDKNFMAPSASLRSELGGVRGPLVPGGSEPTGGPLPVPEVPPEGNFIGASAVSALWRPFFPWLATVHENMNALWRRSGKFLPLYDTFKKVDDQFRQGGRWMQDNYQQVADLLAPFKGKKLSSIFDYLTYPETERTTKLMDKYGLTQTDAQNAHKVWQYMLNFRQDTGISVIQYMNEYHPKLRGFSWAPERVFGMMTTPQQAGFWDRMIRHEGKWDPQDANLGRFLHVSLREGFEKKFTGDALNAAEKMIDRKTPDGTYVIPNSVRWPMKNYVQYMRGIPDTSQQVINKSMSEFFAKANERIKQVNQSLPKGMQIPTMDAPPRQVLNRFMLMSYAMGLGMRPAIAARDMFQAFTGGMTVLGPGRFAKAFTRFMSNPSAAIDRADQAGALLRKNNIGELYGDIMQETPTAGPGWMDRITKWSNALLAPSRWGHNFGRAIMFDGEYHDALESVRAYRAGRKTVDQITEDTSLWFMDRPAQSSLLRDIANPHVPVEDAATRIALEAVDLTQWPYRRGTQPTLLRYGVGRIFGQYGVWPANYADFLYRIGKKWGERPHMAARTTGTWVAVNYALVHGMNALGADTSKWFWQSPAGFAGSPHWDFVHALMVAPEDTDEGHAARKTILEYPLDFVPAMAEMKAIAKALQEGGWNSWPPQESEILRVLGFKPVNEANKEQDWEDFVKTQLGYENTRRRK